MKKVFYILLTAIAAFFVSCVKENTQKDSTLTGNKIVFSATIDMPAAKAELNGLNISWQSGDYIGVATDNDATIKVYPVTVDGTNPSLCTIEVDAVAGASAYYAVFKGRLGHDGGANEVAADDFSMISFDTTTKTFSGLKVGNQQVAKNTMSSYLWYTDGYPLALAGKSNGTSLVMKPCLALVKVKIAAASVPSDYYSTIQYTSTKNIVHNHDYSAVRGFNLYQMGESTVYSSGDFTVQIADNGALTVAPGAVKKEYRQISQSTQLSSSTDYLMCLIPGGSISSFKLDFLGYKDNAGTLSWDAVYSMSLNKSNTVAPGDYFDLGTLDPLGRKKAKNEAADEAADAAGPYVPAIDIDGKFNDWDGVTEYSGNRPNGSSNSRISAWRVKADSQNIFFYLKLNTEKITNSRYLYIGFDTDNNESTGGSHGGIPGAEKYVVVYPAVASSDPVVFVTGVDPRSTVNGSSDGTIATWGVYGTGADSAYSFLEICVPRSKVSLTSAATVSVAVSYNDYNTAKQSLVLQ